MNLKIIAALMLPTLANCAASVSSKKNPPSKTETSVEQQTDSSDEEINDVKGDGTSDGSLPSDEELNDLKVIDKNGTEVALIKENDEWVLKVVKSVELPLQLSKDFAEIAHHSDSIRVLRIENASGKTIGEGSVNHEAGNMEICACENTGLNIGPMADGSCIKLKLSLKVTDKPPQKVTSSFLGIVDISMSGSILNSEEDEGPKDLTIGGTCGI